MTTEPKKFTAKDFATDQDVRWCPGCGDYSILKQVQSVMAELGLDRDNTAVISGIGCSSRFPYYMETYGMHSIHGRAPAFATGLRIADHHVKVAQHTVLDRRFGRRHLRHRVEPFLGRQHEGRTVAATHLHRGEGRLEIRPLHLIHIRFFEQSTAPPKPITWR